MSFTEKADLTPAFVSTFNVGAQAVDDGAADFGTPVYAAGTKWVAGNTMPHGRKLLVVVTTGALTSTPTDLKVALYKGTTSSGGSITAVTSTDTAFGAPAANSVYTTEIDLSYVSYTSTDYYSLGLSSNGAGSSSVIAGAVALLLNAAHV